MQDIYVQMLASVCVTLRVVLERSHPDTAVLSFVMRSTTPWNVDVPLDNGTVTYKYLQMSASRFVRLGKEVWWFPSVTPHVLMERGVVESAGPFANETWLVQYFSAIELMFCL